MWLSHGLGTTCMLLAKNNLADDDEAMSRLPYRSSAR